jgi:5S rRNA maturation endonuclease (ribonuclease M5)
MSHSFYEIAQMADHVRRIDLTSILRITGCVRDKHDKAKWHTPKGVISVTEQKFFNWNQYAGGGGAIDLIMHLNDLDFRSAVIMLARMFPCHIRPPQHTFILPKKDNTQLKYVINYLTNIRCIPQPILLSLIDSGRLYADNRGNAVFLLLGKKKTIVGAELRGTAHLHWRGMAADSKKDLGFFYAGNHWCRKIILCESAIDAISYLALNTNRLAISTSGARPNPAWLKSLIHKQYEIYCGFDADETGDMMAKRMIDMHPQVMRLRPDKHDWNDVLKGKNISSHYPELTY